MTRLAVLSAGPLGRIRGSGRAFAKARSLGVHPLTSEAGQLGQAELEAGAGHLAAALRPAIASTGEAAFAAICTPQLPSDSALAALGAALENEGIGLGLSVTRFALAERLARGEREAGSRTLLLDAYGDGLALFAAPNDATAVEGNLAETCEQRRGAVLRTFREVAEVDLSATAEALDAWLDSVQSSGELDSVANATWYLPDGTRVGVPSDVLEQALDEVQGSWVAAVIEGCVEKAAEDVDCLVVAGWLDVMFHLGPRLRAALPHVRILVLDYEREAEMIHTWIDARERPRAGRVWVVERDFTAAPAQLSWSNGNATPTIEFVPETGAAVVESEPLDEPEEALPAAETPPSPAKPDRKRRAPSPARPRPVPTAPAPASRAPLVAAVAVLALAQIGTISWIARSGRVRAAEGTLGLNDFSAAEAGALEPLAELRADVDELRAQFEGEGQDVTAYRFQIEELESELTKLRFAFDEAPSTEELEALRTEVADARALADEATSGAERTRLTETIAQLALDVQDLQQSELALAQLTREMADLRAGADLQTNADTDSGGAPSVDAARVDQLETTIASLTDAAQRIEADGADARERLEFLEATLEELDLGSSLETLTSTSNLLMERIARNEQALTTRAPESGDGGDVSSSTASLLLDRCETIEQTLRNLRVDVDRLETAIPTTAIVDGDGADPSLVASPSEEIVTRIAANEAAIASVRSALERALPDSNGVELAPSTLYPDLAARHMRVFNEAGARVVHTSYDEEGHGAMRLYGADGSRQVLAGSSKGGDAGFLGTFDRDGNELFMITTLAENGAGHLSLMDGNGERRISMTTDSDGDGVLWIRDGRGRTVEVLGGGGDLAETVRPAPGHVLMPGQVVRVVDSDELGPRVAPCAEAYDTGALGIVSSAGDLEPAMTFGRTGAAGEQAVALAGQVFCLVDAGPHPIRAGDLLASAGRLGHARWADPDCAPPGSIVGKALENLEGGTGLIRVWVQGR